MDFITYILLLWASQHNCTQLSYCWCPKTLDELCKQWTETNIWLLEMLFVMNIQMFDIYILLLVTPKQIVQVTKMISEGRNHVSTPIINLLYFAP